MWYDAYTDLPQSVREEAEREMKELMRKQSPIKAAREFYNQHKNGEYWYRITLIKGLLDTVAPDRSQ